ncbi:MAG: D-alanyl-D-alanine carboxypeptidase [Ruminococcaceae bacterium]|nr:D-alanyl-D-alanine carboxypeptidase [Oscillospiraceae bacterium]
MKFRKFFTFLTALLLVCSLSFSAFATESEETLPPEGNISEETPTVTIEQAPLTPYAFSGDLEVRAKAAMLIELNSNTLVYEYEKHAQLYPASLTKIMTCMLAIEYGDLDAVLTVSETALQNLSEFGSTAGLLEGEELTLNELLYCIMVSSANEGCNVIAEYISDDISTFVDLMNRKAAQLGMTDTHFANAHGLHDENHYTTAYDLSLLARWAWQNDQFREYATATTHVVPATNKSDARTLYSTNYLTTTYVESKYYYSKASGIKTGFTTPAGGCLISTASSGNLEFMCIVMGCSPQTADNGEYGDERFVESKKLFEYGFDNTSFTQVISDTKMVDMPQVLYADGRENVVVRASEDRTVLLPSSCSSDDIELRVEYSSAPLEAPLEEEQAVGVVTAYYNGKAVASCPAVTVTAVARSASKYTAAEAEAAVSSATSWVLRYWYLTLPLLLVAFLLIVLIILRSINVRKAKKRAAARRRNAERRRYNG